jgi:GTP-binding protein Era
MADKINAMSDSMTNKAVHHSGYVNIIGRPNVGKSTLMNALLRDRLSIISNKPQTTRHRIIGIYNDEDYQIVFSDTPGIIQNPSYKMQEKMNEFAVSTFEDADVMIFVTDINEKYEETDPVLLRLQNVKVPLFLVLNKIDTAQQETVLSRLKEWSTRLKFNELIPISALTKFNTEKLFDLIKANLPEGPKYYPDEQLTDRSERFFVSEIIREKILLQYEEEIPYSCEVQIDSFKEGTNKTGQPLTRISATVFVSRDSQKPILIGKNGMAIKKLGTEARKAIETFLENQVFLEINVKVRENWRDDEKFLNYFGYR